ncbi:MAG: hypothetical protein ACI96M_004783, partial [Candidatus Azotimanducaceae bacterium]
RGNASVTVAIISCFFLQPANDHRRHIGTIKNQLFVPARS